MNDDRPPMDHKVQRPFVWIPPDADSTAFRKRQQERRARIEREQASVTEKLVAETLAELHIPTIRRRAK